MCVYVCNCYTVVDVYSSMYVCMHVPTVHETVVASSFIPNVALLVRLSGL